MKTKEKEKFSLDAAINKYENKVKNNEFINANTIGNKIAATKVNSIELEANNKLEISLKINNYTLAKKAEYAKKRGCMFYIEERLYDLLSAIAYNNYGEETKRSKVLEEIIRKAFESIINDKQTYDLLMKSYFKYKEGK
ncbi:hypothetical protein CEG41_00695 [Ureaplasma parvum]|uniref:hypothetical protein n=1 Tax=Ureaplasma parvum TaxID=134821 RepID=UPI000B4D1679|nr:hypothetical protein [Ureaplasma parvum]ASD29222.1 hypothetical protein CEG41_00695 [Ureaplasma parvum]